MNPTQKAAQERARVILLVRSGQLSAKEGARQLGISRKTYYQWEKRALQGMLHELQQQPPGRPVAKSKDPQLTAMEKRIAELESRLEVAQQTAEVRAVLMAMDEARERRARKKKKSKSNNS
jgi:transposase-like protein